jgi:hypothetical protein
MEVEIKPARRRTLSDPKGETPHPDHPHEDEFEFEMHEAAAEEGPHTPEHAAHEPNPLDELGISASTDEFHFTGPAEELDFTEPADFTFPTEHAEAEAGSDSSAEIPTPEHADLEHFFGEESAHHEAAGEVEGVEPALAGEAVEPAAEEEPKPKRELPASVRALEWVTVGVLAAIGLVAPFVVIFALDSPDIATLVVNICFPVLLLLVPYALWRSSSRWTKPAASALYTVLLAIGAAALIGGAWVQSMELSRYNWQFSKSRVAAGRPPLVIIAPPPQATPEQPQK